MTKLIKNLEGLVSDAVAHYWRTRKTQKAKQRNRGVSDAGLRSAVTGGAQMDGFITLFRDLLVIKNRQLIVAIEAKSQVGPSFGNNFNNSCFQRGGLQWRCPAFPRIFLYARRLSSLKSPR